MPLVSNHIINVFQSKDIVSLILLLASPSDNPGGDVALTFGCRLHECGRRYQLPTVLSIMVNIFFTGFVGGVVAEYIFSPFWLSFASHQDEHTPYATKWARYLIDLTCVLVMLLRLGAAVLSGFSHELDPRQYYKSVSRVAPFWISFRSWIKIVPHILLSAFLVPAVSTAFLFFFTGKLTQQPVELLALITKEMTPLIVFCIATAGILALYVDALDQAAKSILCTPGSRLQRFVREVTCGRPPNSKSRESSITLEMEENYLVDVMLHSILHSDSALIQKIWKSTRSTNKQALALEKFEVERNADASEHMAYVLLGVGQSKRLAEAPLEEDMLRHSILESLGGSAVPAPVTKDVGTGTNPNNPVNTKNENIDDYPADDRHRDTIQFWLQPTSKNSMAVQLQSISTTSRRASTESKGATLVRALCAYIGGLGLALTECSKTKSARITWKVPPGAALAAEYALVAIARCIEQNLQQIRAVSGDWRTNPLSPLIPAALSSAFSLHRGVRDYAHYKTSLIRYGYVTPQKVETAIISVDLKAMTDHIGKEHRELFQILKACDAAVQCIMYQLHLSAGNSHNLRSVENAMDSGALQWVRQTISQA
jgi:hypothetical protein